MFTLSWELCKHGNYQAKTQVFTASKKIYFKLSLTSWMCVAPLTWNSTQSDLRYCHFRDVDVWGYVVGIAGLQLTGGRRVELSGLYTVNCADCVSSDCVSSSEAAATAPSATPCSSQHTNRHEYCPSTIFLNLSIKMCWSKVLQNILWFPL